MDHARERSAPPPQAAALSWISTRGALIMPFAHLASAHAPTA